MKKQEQIAMEFITSCSFKDDICAVFLTGSFAFSNADEFSDIDLFIILNDNVKYRERGNKRIDGMLIEYFANPMRQAEKYIDDNYSKVALHEVNMILGGAVIFNKHSAAEKAIAYCKQKLAHEFKAMSEFSIKSGLYSLWDSYDEMRRAFLKQTHDMQMHFFGFIRSAFELYSRYIKSPVPGYHKLYRWLTDDDYCRRYGLPVYNDFEFLEKMRAAFTAECNDYEAMMGLTEDVYGYTLEKMGGFDIDNFVLRGVLDL